MKCVSVATAFEEWRKYRGRNSLTPYFIAVDDADEYRQLRDVLLSEPGVEVAHVVDRCGKDAFPDYDALIECVRDSYYNPVILFGLGEALTFGGDASLLSRIKDEDFPRGLLVVLRGVRRTLEQLCVDDIKFAERNVSFLKPAPFPQITQYGKSLPVQAISGLRELLYQMETGEEDEYAVKSDVELSGVLKIATAYDVCRRRIPGLALGEETLTPDQWRELILAPDMNLVWAPSHWRTFVACKLSIHQNPYLRFVAAKTHASTEWEKAIVEGLLDVPVSDPNFNILYSARKGVVGSANDALINEYVAKTSLHGEDRYAYLTDGTSVERQAIVQSLQGREQVPERVKDQYPLLQKYLIDYQFTCNEGPSLTEYFSRYKLLKVLNRIPPDFNSRVAELAADGSRIYNALPTRGEIVDKCRDNNTQLVWIDGLGVEYLGLIQSLAKDSGLALTIHITRANLPSLTSYNNDFYEPWAGRKVATKELDDIKHGKNGSINYDSLKTPDHLALELDVVSRWIERCSEELHLHKSKRVLIVSDHGASRLAVINESESPWEMKEKGKHSGRCCPKSEIDEKPICATEENGFWVLANYDRFRGGRKACVEVHGGATLEEVVVPVIELALQNAKSEIVVKKPVTKVGLKQIAAIDLFSADKLESVTVELQGKRYPAIWDGNVLYHVEFPDLRRAGQYSIKVFEGDNYLVDLAFTAESAAGKMNKLDDFFK